MQRHGTTKAGARFGSAITTVAAAVFALTAACGSPAPTSTAPAAPVAAVIRPPTMEPGTVPPAPQGKPVLSVTGRITATNADGALRVDRAALDAMGLLEMTVDDPWAKRRLPLRGVWLRDLVDRARPEAGATRLHVTALDDYQVDIPLADVRNQGILLATRTGGGADLPVEDGGPTRVVFADGLTDRFSPDLWIWNIASIEVR